jgi:hypothetical protein
MRGVEQSRAEQECDWLVLVHRNAERVQVVAGLRWRQESSMSGEKPGRMVERLESAQQLSEVAYMLIVLDE